jgi:hypothetical protein
MAMMTACPGCGKMMGPSTLAAHKKAAHGKGGKKK